MLKPEDLIKMAMEEPGEIEEKKPLRKAVDAATNVGGALVGAIGAGVQGIKSLDNKGPVKQIN